MFCLSGLKFWKHWHSGLSYARKRCAGSAGIYIHKTFTHSVIVIFTCCLQSLKKIDGLNQPVHTRINIHTHCDCSYLLSADSSSKYVPLEWF